MCDCHRPSRRTVLRGALGIALTGAAAGLSSGRAVGLSGDLGAAAIPAGTVTPTDVTLNTALANSKPGDAVYGLTWIAGDTHVHNDHSADGSLLRQTVGQGSPGNLSVSDQITKGVTTGLAWMPLTDHRTYDQHWDPLWTSSSLLLMTGEEANGSPHAITLGNVDEIVDAGNPPGSANHRHVQQSIWEAHAQGAVWGTAHPTYSAGQAVTDNSNLTGEHWIEVLNPSSDLDGDIDFAEDRWNTGHRGGVSGASDDHFKELWGVAGPGQPTTFVLTSATTERAILDGLRAGHMTVGTNPSVEAATARRIVLEADVNGDGVYEAVGGDEVKAVAGAAGQLRVSVYNATGASLIIYAAPGRSAGPLVNTPITLPIQVFTVPITIPSGAGWWRAEVRGTGVPGLKTVEGVKPPSVPSGLEGVPSIPADPTDQPLGASAPIFTYTVAPAVPVPAGSPLPTPLAVASADDARAPVAIGAPGTVTIFPDVAVVAGVTHLVAEQHSPGATSIAYRHNAGSASPAITLSTGAAARFPKIAALGNDVYVVWEQDTATQIPHRHDIVVAHSRDGGQTFAAPVAITASPSGGRALRPDVAVLAGGTPVFVWQANASGAAFDVFAQVGVAESPVNLSSAGKTIAAASATDTRSASYPASLFPRVTATPSGGAAVIWQDDKYDVDPLFTGHETSSGAAPAVSTDPDAWEPLVALLAGPGSTWSAPIRIATPPAGDTSGLTAQRHPSIVCRADGVLVAAWDWKTATSSSGADPRLRFSISRDGGLSWSTFGGIDDAGPGTSQRPRLSLDPDGQVRVVWHDSRASDWRWRVRSGVFDDVNGWTDFADLSTAGSSMYPAASGGVVTWTTDRGAAPARDSTQQVVLATVAAPVAGPVAAVALAESPLAVALPLVAIGAAAGAVAWSRRGETGREETGRGDLD